MKPKCRQCTLVVRRIETGAGVTETRVEVSSLEQLFDRCVSLAGEYLLERIVVEGSDGEGHSRALTFTFQSASDRD
jgi:hypothetical protein